MARRGDQGPPEWTIIRFRPRARALVRPAALLVLVVAVACYFAAQLPVPLYRTLITTAAAILVLLLTVVPVLEWLAHGYRVTNRRVVETSGILRRRRTECALDPWTTVSLERRFVQRVTRCGDVVLSREGARILVLTDAPDAMLVGSVVAQTARDALPPGMLAPTRPVQ